MHILIKKQFLYYNNYRIKCAIGKRGIKTKRKEGDFITPRGIFRIKLILYRKDRIKNFKTLSSNDVDKERGFEEIINSPIYKEFIISKDGNTSGILVYIKNDKKMSDLIIAKNDYLNKIDDQSLNSEDSKKYKVFL